MMPTIPLQAVKFEEKEKLTVKLDIFEHIFLSVFLKFQKIVIAILSIFCVVDSKDFFNIFLFDKMLFICLNICLKSFPLH